MTIPPCILPSSGPHLGGTVLLHVTEESLLDYIRRSAEPQDLEMESEEESRCLQVLLDKGLVREILIPLPTGIHGRWRRLVAVQQREETHVVDDS